MGCVGLICEWLIPYGRIRIVSIPGPSFILAGHAKATPRGGPLRSSRDPSRRHWGRSFQMLWKVSPMCPEWKFENCLPHPPRNAPRMTSRGVSRSRTTGFPWMNVPDRHAHGSPGGDTPAESAGLSLELPAKLDNFCWKTHRRGPYQFPAAA